MNISGVLVHAYPENIDAVGKILGQMEGVEVHGNNSDGRIVITVEQENTGQIADLLQQMQDVHGVLSTSMIYHQFED